MESLKLTFTMSLEDWLAFQKHHMKTSARYRDAIFVWRWFLSELRERLRICCTVAGR